MRLQQDHEEVVVKMKQQQQQEEGRIKQQEQPTPALFLCPISLEIMRDPVIVCTGQTYDRGSIDKWIADGHRTCPITMLHLHDLTLIPNIIVRQLIDAWCASDAAASAMFAPYIDQHQQHHHHHQHQHHHLLLDQSPGALQLEQQQQQQQSQSELVVCMLRRIAKGQEVKQSVNRLRALAHHGESGVCGCIIDAGGALLLASILADEMQQDCQLVHHEVEDEDEDEERSSCCGEIMSLLAMLCGGDGTAREAIVNALLSESGALDCVVAHLRVAAARITAAMLLKRLLVTDQIRAALGSAPDFFPALITLISSSPPSSTKSLLKILHRACTHKPNRARAVQHGAIQALTAVLCSPSSSTASPHGAPRGTERALATLELLCGVEQGRRAVCECAAAVHCAVRLLVGCSRQATEFATGCLLLVCQSGPVEVLQLAIRAGARRQLLLLLQSDCSGRAKKKALELLKLFHAIFFVHGDEHVSSDFKNVDLY